MYAIIKTGGKQYKAAKDETIQIDLLEGEVGTKIDFDEVIFVADDNGLKVGSPLVKGAKVSGTIVRQLKGPKIDAFNYKAKKNVRKQWGHRQPYTQVRITEVVGGK